ncbi:asparagine synthase (glutamine-hydrolyzing) [Gammaproteobacteria bacterium]|nr:asparagine synthase (glutamine-hydrolyzing) [Gammaproteobacteria bacterium]MDC3279263.1 asparagine synthase (glutamine-hydrolyzing) [Gammaproteobacteria bacterium]
MCGIAGFTGAGSESDLRVMLSKIAHRGPDGTGVWSDHQGLFLGHKRLSVVDLSGGEQPMRSEDGLLTVIFNGEIYNHVALREDLVKKGYRFKSDHSDTEVLLHGYREWGRGMLERLNGMWAFALLDKAKGVLWLSRDRFGKKPLFYTEMGGELIFASELNSLSHHPSVGRDIDRKAMISFFAHGYIPSPLTIIKGAQKLQAGHNLIRCLRTKKSHLERYWRYQGNPDQSWLKDQVGLGEELIRRLTVSIESRLQADVPVGVFLSGGIDSSSIASLALTALKGEDLRTFSIGFEEESFDETPYSFLMAKHLGTKHTTEIFSAEKCVGLTNEVLGRLDEPLADSSIIPSYLVCQVAAQQVTVGLGGDGADELFAGYDPFRALSPARAYSMLMPQFGHRLLTNLTNKLPVSHRNMSFDFKLKRFLSGAGFESKFQSPIWLSTLPIGHLRQLFRENLELEKIFSGAIDAWDSVERGNDVDKTIQFYIELYLQNDILTKMDRAGMLNSLEVRSPFLDIDFVNLVRTIPSNLKFNKNTTKYILKRALNDVLPVEIVNRKKKGFGIPIGKWFKNQSIEINPNAFEDHFDTEFVRKLYEEHKNGSADWRNFLWAHLVLEKWVEQ